MIVIRSNSLAYKMGFSAAFDLESNVVKKVREYEFPSASLKRRFIEAYNECEKLIRIVSYEQMRKDQDKFMNHFNFQRDYPVVDGLKSGSELFIGHGSSSDGKVLMIGNLNPEYLKKILDDKSHEERERLLKGEWVK